MANTEKSNLITNSDAVPVVMNPVGKSGGRVRIAQDNFEVTTAALDGVGDMIKLCRLPSNARVVSIKLFNDDLDSNANPTIAFDCGIYDTDGTVKDVDAFATASTVLQSASTTGAELFGEAGTAALVALISDRLWEWAGASSDPGGSYDIVLTLTTAAATAAAGTVAFQVMYVID